MVLSFIWVPDMFVFRQWSVNPAVLQAAGRILLLLLLRMKMTAGRWSAKESEDEDQDGL